MHSIPVEDEYVTQRDEPALDLTVDLRGRVIGERHELTELLSSSDQGSIYLGRDRISGRPIEIKILAPTVAPGRLRERARAMIGLAHAGLATVYAEGAAENGASFIVSEHVDGRNLHYLHGDPRLAWPAPLQLAQQLAEALSTLHAAGVIHGAVSASNIVWHNSDASPPRVQLVDRELPTTELSPRNLTAETDLMALGAVLYELCTSRSPDVEPLDMRGEDAAIDVPEAFESVIVGLLDASTCPRSAMALLDQLETVDQGGSGASAWPVEHTTTSDDFFAALKSEDSVVRPPPPPPRQGSTIPPTPASAAVWTRYEADVAARATPDDIADEPQLAAPASASEVVGDEASEVVSESAVVTPVLSPDPVALPPAMAAVVTTPVSDEPAGEPIAGTSLWPGKRPKLTSQRMLAIVAVLLLGFWAVLRLTCSRPSSAASPDEAPPQPAPQAALEDLEHDTPILAHGLAPKPAPSAVPVAIAEGPPDAADAAADANDADAAADADDAVPDQVSAAVFRQALLKANRSQATRNCYSQHGRSSDKPEAVVLVNERGRVQKIRMQDSPLTKCLSQVLRNLQFPAARQSAQHNYVFRDPNK